jgi:hypothetical protein
MKKNTLHYVIATSLLLLPLIVSAAPLDGVKGLLTAFGGLINITIRIIFGLAMVYFFWGTAQFVLHSGDAKVRSEGKSKMLWGVIALFVLISIWGIIGFIGSTLGIKTGGTLSPTSGIFPGGSGGNGGGGDPWVEGCPLENFDTGNCNG